MADICDLILQDHEEFRSAFTALFEARQDASADQLATLWDPLADSLDRHAAAEEATFYPRLLKDDGDADDETEDAVKDHNKIRDAVRAATGAELGSSAWWSAVEDARKENDEHMSEEEDGPIPDFRSAASGDERAGVAEAFRAYKAAHPGDRVDRSDRDPKAFVAEHER